MYIWKRIFNNKNFNCMNVRAIHNLNSSLYCIKFYLCELIFEKYLYADRFKLLDSSEVNSI